MGKILVVDDEPNMRRILVANLRQEKHEVVEAGSVGEARRALTDDTFDAVITDQKMADGEGLDVLAGAHDVDPTLSVVFLTAFATIELAVESMKRGAFDFITKPFAPEVMLATSRRAVEHTELRRENDRLREAMGRLEGSSEIKGSSAAIGRVRAMIARVAPTNATVLISGETGTGKELVARAIHRSSRRAAKPFVAVNCAAFTETLLESELFGHERGAFTGAERAREGLFETAHQGTLFLDEVAEMSPAAQAKLLRVLADGQVLRVGASRARQVDVRVIVATHRDLKQRVSEGLFREDLYYRLAVVPISIPALRERRADIPELCELFVVQAAQELKVPPRRLSSDALQTLMNYEYPGNIRELRNLIERACILAAGEEIGSDFFPVTNHQQSNAQQIGSATPAGSTPEALAAMAPQSFELRAFLNGFEKAVIVRALHATGGAQAEAARRLGLSRSDIAYKIDKYGIRPATE